ncbi:unnamed protein product [Arctia plantaginis]|uniref:Uncharacterized protein n=1 Tax=Arctia plantaginis TaxID=874455 RepID=A0A8S1B077_ARCPL|nr:unnamed protein product [Arctia plantaginis]
MTSIILAQKLVSVKLTKEEFDKVRCLKANNIENKFKMIPYLKKTIDNQMKTKICRICLRPGKNKIFGDQEFDCITAMKQILQIEVKANDRKPQHICLSCERTLKDAEQLKQTAEVTQWRLQQELDMVSSLLLEHEDKNHHGGFFVEQGSTMTRKWSCGKCRRTFDNQESFTEHEKLLKCRSQNQVFVCETCGIELKTLSRLKRHSLVHSCSLRFPCGSCPYRARTLAAARLHARAHAGARPLACALCAATFRTSSNLASHRRTHLPPAYACQLCANAFKFKEALQNHLATRHSTAKPHVCNMCGKAFATRKMLCRHERRVHNRPKMRPGILPTYLRQQEEPT